MRKEVVEGLIFLSGDEGLTPAQLMEALEITKDELDVMISELMNDYADRGFELVYFGDHYKFLTNEAIHPYAEKIYSSAKMATLSNSALETLAIIAYKQPITRSEVEEIRGINCDNMIRKLMARSLIKECGRSDAPGRPFLYEVTQTFMDTFKLESLNELPELKEVEEDDNEEFLNVEEKM